MTDEYISAQRELANKKSKYAVDVESKALDYFKNTGLGDGSQLDPSGDDWNHMLDVMGDVWKAKNESIRAETYAKESEGYYETEVRS